MHTEMQTQTQTHTWAHQGGEDHRDDGRGVGGRPRVWGRRGATAATHAVALGQQKRAPPTRAHLCWEQKLAKKHTSVLPLFLENGSIEFDGSRCKRKKTKFRKFCCEGIKIVVSFFEISPPKVHENIQLQPKTYNFAANGRGETRLGWAWRARRAQHITRARGERKGVLVSVLLTQS